jgi:hypothetical protein
MASERAVFVVEVKNLATGKFSVWSISYTEKDAQRDFEFSTFRKREARVVKYVPAPKKRGGKG